MEKKTEVDEIAAQIAGALALVIEALRRSIATVHASNVHKGLDPYEDPSLFSHSVRRLVREDMKTHFPNIDRTSPNMSPIHLLLGPHELRLMKTRDGALPPPRTDARMAYYAKNDQGILALNIFPPDDLIEIEDDLDSITEATLVLLWSSKDAELTRVRLCKPSLKDWPGPCTDLLATSEAEADFDEIQRSVSDDDRQRTGTRADESDRDE
jgi:hypothetical protein